VGICVAGMHRSGTSMVIRLLYECGIYLGNPIDLVPPSPNNEEGHFENRHFVDINDRILETLGGGWDYPPALESGWPARPELASCREDAARLVTSFDRHQPWAWKDPRNSLTVPFWDTLIPELRVVVCLRNPLEVADSLNRRSFNSRGFGLNLWLEYNRAILDAIPPERRLITHYDAYFADARQELTRVLLGLGLQVPVDTIDRACATVSDRLRHNRHREIDLDGTAVPAAVLDLYRNMGDEAERPVPGPKETLDLVASPADASPVAGDVTEPSEVTDPTNDQRWLDHLRGYTARLSYQVNDLTRELQSLREMEVEQHRLAEHLVEVDRLRDLADRQRETAERERENAKRERENAEGEREAAERERQIAQFHGQLGQQLIWSLINHEREIERILVVKTSQVAYVRINLELLGSLFPRASISIWSEERESEELFLRPDVDRVVLYRNVRSIPAMRRELAAIAPDILIVQATNESTYAKMQVLAAVLLSQPWLVYDDHVDIHGALSIGAKIDLIRRTLFSETRPIVLPFAAALGLVRVLYRFVAFPVVLLTLLAGVARHEYARSRYLRRRSRTDAL
jgi:hypothetical protein